MKIKKNGKVIRLTESDLKRIVKKVLTEEKISFKECNLHPDIFEWVNDISSNEGQVASRDKRLYICSELLESDNINAGFLSKISDKGMKDKKLKKSVKYCMSTLSQVREQLEKMNSKYTNRGYLYTDVLKSPSDFLLKYDYFKKLNSEITKYLEEKLGPKPPRKDEKGNHIYPNPKFDEWVKKTWPLIKEKWDPEEKIKQLKEVSQCLHRSYF